MEPFSSPYDKMLDEFMRAHGWTSYRQEIEDGIRTSDFMFDMWSIGEGASVRTVQAVGNRQFEWLQGGSRILVPSRAAVINAVLTGVAPSALPEDSLHVAARRSAELRSIDHS